MKVSDLITNEDIKSWKQGDLITITAGTGKGKTYFIMNKLYDSTERFPLKGKILFLIHRINPRDQFFTEINEDNKTDLIDIKTYQSIEIAIKEGNKQILEGYQYIVMDEYHRFLNDSFTTTTDISLDAILKQDKAIKIAMSATGNYMMKYFNEHLNLKTIDYEIPLSFDSIRSLRYFKKDSTLEALIADAIEENRKTIVFVDSAKKAYELHQMFGKDTLFNCSTTSRSHGYGKYVDKDKIQQMLESEKFKETVLITTTVMDSGVNIKDSELTQIICDVRDVVTLGQAVGRKRIMDEGDYIDLIIKAHNGDSYRSIRSRAEKQCELAEYLTEHKTSKFNAKYGRSKEAKRGYYGVVYDVATDDTDRGSKRVNELVHYRAFKQLQEIQYMWDFGRGKFIDGYCKFIAQHFSKFDLETNTYDYEFVEDVEHMDRLESYLDSIVGKVMLQLKDRKELIEKIDVKQNGKLLTSLNSLNSALEEKGFNYRIVKFETSRMIDGKKRNFKSAWRVMKLVEK